VLDFTEDAPLPFTLAGVWDRFARLVRSLQDVRVLKELPDAQGTLRPITLATGANAVPHNQRGEPKAVVAQVVGSAASTAQVTTGLIATKFVTLYATAPCTVHLVVYV
jgi:hypothetical protein